jgi:NAD(P)-dependent dehydrogenase (short-subunit alcohol dehydrogenase family)
MTAPVAIITGASQGIGAGLVAGYRGAGYGVVGVARSLPSSDDSDYVLVAGDIAHRETAQRAVDEALDRFGRIDLAVEYASHGVRVNAVSLGVIRTPVHDPASYEELEALHPLGRVGEISDVVDTILYLEGAAFVTGETLHVDGGQAAGR